MKESKRTQIKKSNGLLYSYLQDDNKRRYVIGIAVMIIVIGIIMMLAGRVIRVNIKAGESSDYVKAVVLKVVEDESSHKEFGGHQKVQVKITRGKYKGQVCELTNSNSYQLGAYCVEGTKVIARIAADENGNITGAVFNYDREGVVWFLVAAFAISLIVIGGKKGVSSLVALVYTMLCIVFCYIPLIYIGVNPMFAAVVSAIIILCATIFLINGWSDKSCCAMIGTTVGVTISGMFAFIAGQVSHLSGYNMTDVESMVYISNYTHLGVADILFAGILISSLGAVMDVSVSVVAAIKEISVKAPELGFKDLFMSGMHVGHDMMGTMSNTLILAYVGAATGTVLTIYSYEMPYLQIMGYNSIVIEIVSGICGTIGVILTVPVQAAITAFWLKKKK